jgi:hypothetical protein
MNDKTLKPASPVREEMISFEMVPETTRQTPLIPSQLSERAVSQLSRRELFRRAGLGAAMLMALAGAEIGTATPGRAQIPLVDVSTYQPTTDTGKQQFPYYTDTPWDQQQYYETIQAGRRQFPKTYQTADIDGDGRDELIARGPGGIHVSRFDHDTGQWVPMPEPLFSDGGKLWRDDYGWDQPQYYQTIQTADIDGDGQAELIGRGGEGIEIYKYDKGAKKWNAIPGPHYPGDPHTVWNNPLWDLPKYYTTIQCADINGDGKDELIGRGGMGLEIFAYDPSLNPPWKQLPLLIYVSDANGGSQPEVYSTLQCARVLLPGDTLYHGDGTHSQAAVQAYMPPTIGQPAIMTYVYDGASWQTIVTNIDRLDGKEYYSTFQCGDIDGDGRDELIGRYSDGLRVWRMDASLHWTPMTAPKNPIDKGALWRDDYHWNQPQYYQTIQLADVDGDGRDELIGRGGLGIELYDFDAGSWRNDDSFTDYYDSKASWSDRNRWDWVQHYSTIQSARVLLPGRAAAPGSPATISDAGYTGDGTHAQSVLMGRGSKGVQTWRYINAQHGWTQASALVPVWTDAFIAAYHAIGTQMHDSLASDIRAHYSNETFVNNGRFGQWQHNLYSNLSPGSYDQDINDRPATTLPRPTNNPLITEEVWNAVTWQIWWELQWVKNVYAWYGPDQAGGLIDKNVIEQFLTLQKVGGYVNIPPDDTLSIVFTSLGLIAGVLAAVLSGGAALSFELPAVAAELGVQAAIAGAAATAFSSVPGLLPAQGGAFQVAYNQLQDKIDQTFTAAIQGNDILKFALTGGMSSGVYYPPDYGRLKQIGQWIQDEIWLWPTGPGGGQTSELVVHAARGYAISCWKTLLTAQPWHAWRAKEISVPSDYPTQYLYNGWIFNLYPHEQSLTPKESLAALFDTIKKGTVFPLGVPLGDVFEGKRGWPISGWTSSGLRVLPPPQTPLPSLSVDIRSTVSLARDANTNEIVATVTLLNHGMTTATNAEITGATLGGRSLIADHSQRQMRLFHGQPQTITLHFASLPPGTSAVLRVSGKHLGGTFGASLRVKVP